MRRRFVIGADALTKAQESKFREHIASKGAWWHWIGNLGLFTTINSDISAQQIRDYILDLHPEARVVVLEFPEDLDWAASNTKSKSGKELAGWLKSPWGLND